VASTKKSARKLVTLSAETAAEIDIYRERVGATSESDALKALIELGLKYSDGLTRFWPTAATAIAIVLSFALMALALRSLPFGTAYAVWTGIGAVGSIIVGMLLYSEPTDPVRIICLTLIVAGMVGLKLNSPV